MASTQQTVIASPRIERLRDFVVAISNLVETEPGEPGILREGSRLLKELVGVDDWLPARYAEPSVTGYQQYLLHADSRERFSVVSFVWGPGPEIADPRPYRVGDRRHPARRGIRAELLPRKRWTFRGARRSGPA